MDDARAIARALDRLVTDERLDPSAPGEADPATLAAIARHHVELAAALLLEADRRRHARRSRADARARAAASRARYKPAVAEVLAALAAAATAPTSTSTGRPTSTARLVLAVAGRHGLDRETLAARVRLARGRMHKAARAARDADIARRIAAGEPVEAAARAAGVSPRHARRIAALSLRPGETAPRDAGDRAI